jgi:predicted dehydrogenase
MELAGGIASLGLHWVTQIMQLPAYRSAELNLVAAAEPDPTQRAQAEAQGVVPQPILQDWQEAADRDDVAVLDCSFGHRPGRQEVRQQVIRAAARREQAVMLHKPLAASLDVARQLVELAEDLGVTVAVNQNCRFNPAATSVGGLLQPERLGRPRVIELTSHWRGPIRSLDRDFHATVSHTVHHADLIRWWVGRPCVSVSAERRDAVTVATYTFDDGTIAQHTEHHSGTDHHKVRFKVLAERGVIEGGHNWCWHLPSAAGEDFVSFRADTADQAVALKLPEHIYEPEWSRINPYLPHEGPWYDLGAPVAGMLGTMAELLDAQAVGRRPSHHITEGYESLRMAHAAVWSARRGTPLHPDEVPADSNLLVPGELGRHRNTATAGRSA